MAKSLPADIIQEILSRLPVKSLLRFRCVSKAWCAIIYSSSFVKSHLKKSTTTKSVADIIFDNCVKLNQLCDETSGDIVVEDFKHPFSPLSEYDSSDLFEYHQSSRVVGSSCGLLHIIKSCNSDAILFNPSIRNHCKIPKIEKVDGLISCKRRESSDLWLFLFPPLEWWFWGCGFDEVTDDIKLIGINVVKSFLDGESETFGWIYSLKLGAWRRIEDMPNFQFHQPESGAFICNAVHWLIYDRPFGCTPGLVAAFDMGTEEFRLVPLPKYYIKNDSTSYHHFDLCVLDECLCFSYSGVADQNVVFLEFWIMREYGADESNWVKLMKVNDFDSESGIWRMKPIAFSENGKVLLIYVRECDLTQSPALVWYDLETGLLKRKVDNLPSDLGVPHVYVPSLVDPNYPPDHAKMHLL